MGDGTFPADHDAQGELVRRLLELTEQRTRALEAGDFERALAVGAERSRVIEALRSVRLSPEAVQLIQRVVEADREALRQIQAEVVRVKEELKRVRQARSRLWRRWGRPEDGGGFERRA